MSKNLEHIPKQMNMTEEQEQVFTNGINKGRKLEREHIIQLLEDNNSCNGGISTGTCFCAAIGFLEGEK
jgi:hypothetical protein